MKGKQLCLVGLIVVAVSAIALRREADAELLDAVLGVLQQVALALLGL